MSNLAPARETVPYRLLAGQPFEIGWSPSEEDGTAFGAPADMASVVDISITASLRISRGQTQPAATVWTKTGGDISLAVVDVGAVGFPSIDLIATAPGVGVYDVTVIMIGADGSQDWLLSCVFEVFPQAS